MPGHVASRARLAPFREPRRHQLDLVKPAGDVSNSHLKTRPLALGAVEKSRLQVRPSARSAPEGKKRQPSARDPSRATNQCCVAPGGVGRAIGPQQQLAKISSACRQRRRRSPQSPECPSRQRSRTRCVSFLVSLHMCESAVRILPAQCVHVGVHVITSTRAEVHVIGVFVHIERDQRMSIRQRHGVVERR